MKLKKFIDALDQIGRDAIKFFRKEGREIFADDKLLLAVTGDKWSREKRLRLIRLAWIVGIELGSRHKKEETHFGTILPVYDSFHDYMWGGGKFFGDKQVPFEEWSDLAKEQDDLLTLLIKENKLISFWEDKRYHDLCDKWEILADKLFKKGYHRIRDGEYR